MPWTLRTCLVALLATLAFVPGCDEPEDFGADAELRRGLTLPPAIDLDTYHGRLSIPTLDAGLWIYSATDTAGVYCFTLVDLELDKIVMRVVTSNPGFFEPLYYPVADSIKTNGNNFNVTLPTPPRPPKGWPVSLIHQILDYSIVFNHTYDLYPEVVVPAGFDPDLLVPGVFNPGVLNPGVFNPGFNPGFNP